MAARGGTTGTAHRRRELVSTVALLAVSVFAVGAVIAVDRSRSRGVGEVRPADLDTGAGQEPSPTPSPAPDSEGPPAPGDDALVDVAVANLWSEPAATRAVDEPSLANPVDVARWLSAMTTDDRLWLVGRTVTQSLYGDRVRVLEARGDWSRVVVAGQPSSLHPDGYPGWLPARQLRRAPAPDTRPVAAVTAPVTVLHDPADPNRPVMELAYATRLPVVGADDRWVTVATPAGTPGLLAATDVAVSAKPAAPPRGPDVVDSARQFSGLPYLWAGTSGLGFDCSGLTWAVYGTHGVVIPRDAADQAAAGRPVDPAHLEPGDLLFYAGAPGDRETIHHVAMYVGDGRMIQSPATGRSVETVPIDTPAYAHEFWGARRYLGP